MALAIKYDRLSDKLFSKPIKLTGVEEIRQELQSQRRSLGSLMRHSLLKQRESDETSVKNLASNSSHQPEKEHPQSNVARSPSVQRVPLPKLSDSEDDSHKETTEGSKNYETAVISNLLPHPTGAIHRNDSSKISTCALNNHIAVQKPCGKVSAVDPLDCHKHPEIELLRKILNEMKVPVLLPGFDDDDKQYLPNKELNDEDLRKSSRTMSESNIPVKKNMSSTSDPAALNSAEQLPTSAGQKLPKSRNNNDRFWKVRHSVFCIQQSQMNKSGKHNNESAKTALSCDDFSRVRNNANKLQHRRRTSTGSSPSLSSSSEDHDEVFEQKSNVETEENDLSLSLPSVKQENEGRLKHKLLSDANEEALKEAEYVNYEIFFEKARELKHRGDSEADQLSKVKFYMNAIICYLLGYDRIYGSNRGTSKEISLLKSTLALTRYAIELRLQNVVPGVTRECRLAILYLKMEAFIHHKIYAAYQNDEKIEDDAESAVVQGTNNLMKAPTGRNNKLKQSSVADKKTSVNSDADLIDRGEFRFWSLLAANKIWADSVSLTEKSGNQNFFDAIESGSSFPWVSMPTTDFALFIRESLFRIERMDEVQV